MLLVLSDGDLHGYGIMKEVERESRGTVRLGVGSLYRTLSRLLDSRLIEEAGGGADAKGAAARLAAAREREEQRRYYRLSPFGRQVAKAEAERLREVLRLARAKGLVEAAGDTP
ncbi:MAG TPA: helix-turn-helix transcriptional regulator [Thermoanaerobaculia bacterium]|nr:helix-turn-helix transcriptional regulator [Thermoanaerobaculia bacterium]